MPKKNGREFLIKMGDGADPEVFSTICGLTSKSFTLNNETFDVTTADCEAPSGALWRELLTGMKSVSLSGNGLFENKTQSEAIIAIAMAGESVANFQVIWPDLGVFAGAFVFATFEGGGEQAGGVTQGLSLESTGEVTFTAAA